MAVITIEVDIAGDETVTLTPNPARADDGDTVRWHVRENAHGGGVTVTLPADAGSPFGNADRLLQAGIERAIRCNVLEPSTAPLDWPEDSNSYTYRVEAHGSPPLGRAVGKVIRGGGLADLLSNYSSEEIETALAELGIVLEAVLPAPQLLRGFEHAMPAQAEIDRFPADSAKEMKLKPRAPGVPGFPGNAQISANPGAPGAPGFPTGESHADVKVFAWRNGNCDFVILHRKIVIPAGQSLTIRWNDRWCKAIVEAQLGVVIVRARRRDLFILDVDGTAQVQSRRPPCPAGG